VAPSVTRCSTLRCYLFYYPFSLCQFKPQVFLREVSGAPTMHDSYGFRLPVSVVA
jgi:hypothetical protein